MMDEKSFALGIAVAFITAWIVYEIILTWKIGKKVTIPIDIANDIVGETPHCPDCGSYELKMVDVTDGVAWLKGYTPEIDFYQCKRCMRQFSDEDWYDAKKYGDSTGIDD